MGGLRKKMPATFWTFLAGGLALSGFPIITAGFWSKDEILTGAFASHQVVIFIILAVSALFTAFYTARQLTLVFLGKPRTAAAEHASESRKVMTVPLVILAVFAIAIGWVGIPKAFPLLGSISPAWFQEFVGTMLAHEVHEEAHSYIPLLVSILVSLGGLLLGWLTYRKYKSAEGKDPLQKLLGAVFTFLQNKYKVDELYQTVFINPSLWFAEKVVYQFLDLKIIDGILHGLAAIGVWLGNLLRYKFDVPIVNGAGDGLAKTTRGTGGLLHRQQTGKVQQYLAIAIGITVVAGLIILLLVKSM